MEEDLSFGPAIAIIIIISLLIIGGLYIWKKSNLKGAVPRGVNISADSVINSFARQNDSDDIEAIRKDLSATSIQALDQGLSPLIESQ